MQTKLLLLLFCLFLSACAGENAPVALPPYTIAIRKEQTTSIRLNRGDLTIVGSEDRQVHVDGQTLFPGQTEYNVTALSDRIQVVANYSGTRSSNSPISLRVSVPNQMKLQVETEQASILIRDYSGKVEAVSVSGDILLENINGGIVARSSRGDVRVQDSVGKISVVGNYGLLTVENTTGEIGVSTIMGTITFKGSLRIGDSVSLETDHGPVAVNLDPDSELNLQVQSTSGDVACMLPNVSSSLRSCKGKFNSGGGVLNIRTVSGAVTLQLIP